MSVAITVDDWPFDDGEKVTFKEVSVPNGETEIIVTAPGCYLGAIVFGTGFEGATMTVSPLVPWAAGDAYLAVNGLSITVSAGEVVQLAPADMLFLADSVKLTVNAAQTSAHSIGVFLWNG